MYEHQKFFWSVKGIVTKTQILCRKKISMAMRWNGMQIEKWVLIKILITYYI